MSSRAKNTTEQAEQNGHGVFAGVSAYVAPEQIWVLTQQKIKNHFLWITSTGSMLT